MHVPPRVRTERCFLLCVIPPCPSQQILPLGQQRGCRLLPSTPSKMSFVPPRCGLARACCFHALGELTNYPPNPCRKRWWHQERAYWRRTKARGRSGTGSRQSVSKTRGRTASRTVNSSSGHKVHTYRFYKPTPQPQPVASVFTAHLWTLVDLLCAAVSGLGNYISGVILYDETFNDTAADGYHQRNPHVASLLSAPLLPWVAFVVPDANLLSIRPRCN